MQPLHGGSEFNEDEEVLFQDLRMAGYNKQYESSESTKQLLIGNSSSQLL